MPNGWGWHGSSNRIIIREKNEESVKRRVEESRKRGFEPIMDIKPDVDRQGDTFYVCIMENKEAPRN